MATESEMANNQDNFEKPNDLHWLAFRYAAGELPTGQADDFEARLADDFDAQVALAEMVALASVTHKAIETIDDHGKVRLTSIQPVESRRSLRWQWIAAAVSVAAGVLFIGSAWQFFPEIKHQQSMAANELELWDRSVEIYQEVRLNEDEFEIADDDSEAAQEIESALSLDSDLTSIFASAFSLSDQSEVEL